MADPTITERLVDKLLAIRFDSIPAAAIEARASRMLELVERLDTLPDVVEIMDIARAEGRAS